MPVEYEGGNFQADGFGTCYTTERGVQYAGVNATELAHRYQAYAGCDNLVTREQIAFAQQDVASGAALHDHVLATVLETLAGG